MNHTHSAWSKAQSAEKLKKNLEGKEIYKGFDSEAPCLKRRTFMIDIISLDQKSLFSVILRVCGESRKPLKHWIPQSSRGMTVLQPL